MKICLIPTSTAKHLAKGILLKTKGIEVVFPDLSKDRKRYFPDGEIYMRILKAARLISKRVIILHSGAPKPNEGLIELELILQILRDNKIKPEVFFSYFPYGMQDKVFEKGETNVAENLIEKLVNYYKIKKIYVIDPHFGGRKWVKKYPIVSISAVSLLIEKARQDFGNNILFLSTDVGSQRRTKIPGLKKKRLSSSKVKIKIFPQKPILKGKIVGLIDDIIETGTTLIMAFEKCKEFGADKVLALVTHGVLNRGVEKVKKKFDKVYLTNSIKGTGVQIDITELILDAIKK